MKLTTTCLAIGLAGLGLTATGQAAANSSVTLYGLLDINLEAYNHSPSGTVSGMRSSGQSGSHWGLRGTEDLGNGLKAIFVLESGFGVRNGLGDGRMFQRTAMLGLSGSWGTMSFGRQYTSSFDLSSGIDVYGYSPSFRPSGLFIPTRADNMIKYQHKLGQLEASGYFAFRGQEQQMSEDVNSVGSYGVAARYALNRVRFMGGYDRVNAPGAAQPATGKTDNLIFAADTAFGAATLAATYRHRKVRQNGAQDIRSNLFNVGLGYSLSPAASVQLNYILERFKNAPGGYLGLTDDIWHQVMARGLYNLSKRTNLYLVLAHSRNGPLNLGSNNDVGGPAYVMAENRRSQTGVALGMRHRF